MPIDWDGTLDDMLRFKAGSAAFKQYVRSLEVLTSEGPLTEDEFFDAMTNVIEEDGYYQMGDNIGP